MNRIWLATILGLLLGAILYGMLSSGRDAGAAPEMGARSRAEVIRQQVAPTQTTRPTTTRRFPAPINEPRYLASAPPTTSASDAESIRERIRADQRRLAEERRRRLQANAAGGSTTQTTYNDGRRQEIQERMAAFADARQARAVAQQERMDRLRENRRRRLEMQGGGLDPAAVRMAEAADARDAFRDQLAADDDRRPGDDPPNAADAASKADDADPAAGGTRTRRQEAT